MPFANLATIGRDLLLLLSDIADVTSVTFSPRYPSPISPMNERVEPVSYNAGIDTVPIREGKVNGSTHKSGSLSTELNECESKLNGQSVAGETVGRISGRDETVGVDVTDMLNELDETIGVTEFRYGVFGICLRSKIGAGEVDRTPTIGSRWRFPKYIVDRNAL